MSDNGYLALMLLGPIGAMIYFHPSTGLPVAGGFLILLGALVFGVAKGGIHEVTAAVLVAGGFGLIGLAALLTALEPIVFVARHFRARIINPNP